MGASQVTRTGQPRSSPYVMVVLLLGVTSLLAASEPLRADASQSGWMAPIAFDHPSAASPRAADRGLRGWMVSGPGEGQTPSLGISPGPDFLDANRNGTGV